MRDIEWFDENGDTMRPEDWRYWEGRLLCVRRAVRLLDGQRAKLCLLLINSTGEAHAFQLPQPVFRWTLRLDTAADELPDRLIEQPQLEVAPHSLQLLTAVVEAPSPERGLHSAGDSAMQPDQTMAKGLRALLP